MNHEEFRELAALDAYGEIDGADRERWEAHRGECRACRELAQALRNGLGRHARALERDDLPADWAERMRESVRAAAPAGSRPRAFAVGAAAGIAAGFAAAYLTFAPGAAAEPERGANRASFGRETPPPRAATFGELAHLGRSRRE